MTDTTTNPTMPLPASIAAALQDMQMPLGPDSYKAMHYKSLEEMVQIRRAANTIHQNPMTLDVVGTIAVIRTDTFATDSTEEYLARCATALLLLGHGATDEAHDLVSPLSWPNTLEFAYGPPVVVAEQVLSLASYVHALVHRREGPHASEFNMTGFVNADYWAGSALRSPEGAEALPLEEIRSSLLQLASRSTSSVVQEWTKNNIEADPEAFPVWDPRVLNQLCGTLQKQTTPSPHDTAAQHEALKNVALQAFAEDAFLSEMKILLKHTLRAIGYDV